MSDTRQRLRAIPSTDHLLRSEGGARLLDAFPRELVVECLQRQSDRLRQSLLEGGEAPVEGEEERWLLEHSSHELEELLRPRLRRVVNATGVVLHTNLGRAPLPEAAMERLREVCRGYSNLELDLESGKRGSRYSNVVELILRLTGAQGCLVVNNCAAAMMLMVSTLASGREVVVSRGELVEIGGSYRLPDVLAAAGARLVEVGTTNKTRLSDYEKAVGPNTAMLLASHLSNFRIVGFTERPERAELVELGRKLSVPVCLDLGSGLIDSFGLDALREEPTVREMVQAGFDLVAFSGDKLLGGPQAGVLVGRREAVERLRRSPMNRALRVDKLTLSCLEATLALYLDRSRALSQVPVLRMLAESPEQLERRARALAAGIGGALGSEAQVEVCSGSSSVGGGSLPGQELPTWLVSIRPRQGSEEDWATRLRRQEPPVMVLRREGALLLDPRTLSEGEGLELEEAFGRLLA
ncbi:MAG: L-seryl-tRNA(Sec) selenium transferase [Armatimonadetes bacterium]|nr:L-seryl-tRNA(Sec) selenium transferase [Armatimonadota bacterium]